MNPFAIPSLLSFLVALFLGGFVYSKNSHGRANKVFLVFCLLAAYAGFTEFMLRNSETAAEALLWRRTGGIWPFLIAVIVHFVLIITEHFSWIRRKSFLFALYMPAVCFSAINIVDLREGSIPIRRYWGWTYGIPNRFLLFWAFILLTVTILICLRFYLRVRDRRKKKQAKFILISFSIPVLFAYITNLIYMAGGRIPELFTVSFILGSVFIAYGIWKYDLFILTPKTTGESIVDAMTDGLFLLLPDGTIVNTNKAAADLLRSTEENILGTSVFHLIPEGKERESLLRTLEDDPSYQTPVKDHETSFFIDNTLVPVSLSMSKIIKAGQIEGIVFIARDVSERTRARVELMKARDSAEAANRAKSVFLANMSHEIRTPMNSILGFTGILLEMEQNHEKREMLEIISRSGKNLLNLINDILDFSKIEAGKVELEKINFSLSHLLQEIRNLFLIKANEKNISLHLDMDPALPAYVFGDEHKINQIIMNLVSNAVKFTRKGTITITCRYDSGITVVSVKDTGIGISREKQKIVFSAFKQGDISTTREFGGTGLGLAITKKLVEKMGGEIAVKSEPDKGTEFIVRLSLPEVKEPDKHLADESYAMYRYDPARTKIALIDNDENDIAIIKNMLNKTGFTPVILSNTPDAARLVAESEAEIVLLDLKMEGLNGYQINDILKSDTRTSHIPVVVCSIMDGLEETINYGVFDYIRKPVEERTFLKRIKSALYINGDVKNIFVIDDDKDLLLLYKNLLHAQQYNVFVFDNAKAALQDLKKGIIPDLILLDLMMPGLDGFEFLGLLRDKMKREDIPVIIMTAKDLTDDDMKRLKEKCLNIFKKTPETGKGLVDFINQYFKRRNIRGKSMVQEWFSGSEGDPEMQRLLQDGLKKLPEKMDRVNTVYRDGGVTDEFRKLVHDMKGFTGNYGMTEIYEVFREIDRLIHESAPEKERFEELLHKANLLLDAIPAEFIKPAGKRPLSVLVAEDNSMNQKLISVLLERLGHEFTIVSNGKEVMEALEKKRFDILLLDIQMPVMDGMETIKQIRGIPAYNSLWVIALTAYAIKGDEERFLAAGCDDYISKPIDKESFYRKISQAARDKGLSVHSAMPGEEARIDLDSLSRAEKERLGAILSRMEDELHAFFPEKIHELADEIRAVREGSAPLKDLVKELKQLADDYNDEEIRRMINTMTRALHDQ